MAKLIAVSPTSKVKDIFGKELSLTDAQLKVLGEVGDVFLAKQVQLEIHSKKGDATDPRLLVLSSSRCYILQLNPVTKLETSFNFLKLQQLRCSENKLSMQLLGETRLRDFQLSRQDSVEVVGLITAQIKNVFPVTPLDLIMKLTFDPDSLSGEVTVLREELMAGMDRVDATSLEGFLTAYAFLSDFFGVKYNTEISWYLKNVYLAHGLREIKLADFDQYQPRELLPVMSSLRHNSYFEGVVEKSGKVSPELLEELWYVVRSSQALRTLVLADCGLKPDNVVRLSAAITNNHRAVVTHLDLSDSLLEDKGLEGLCGALESLQHGLQVLKLANCKITAKGNSMLAQSLKKNKQMQYSLVHLDLSGNPLGPDPQGGLAFLQDPQTVATLKLARCSLVLDSVVPVLNRGCTQHLSHLDLSQNPGRLKKGASSLGPSLKQFCSSSISVQCIKLTGCKLSSVVITSVLEGLSDNVNVTGVQLDVSGNELGGGAGVQPMLQQFQAVSCVSHLDLSDTGLDAHMVEVIVALAENRNIRHLKLGKNFNGRSKSGAIQALAQLLEDEECQLLSVSVEDSHLKELTVVLLNALAENNSLTAINLTGNHMGHRGVAMLAKALLCNCRLRMLEWDHNDTPLRGFQEVTAAMKHNYTLRVMPLPLHDIGRAGKGVEEHVQLMQQYLCRNHSDERLKVEMAARHRNRLLTATQQSSVVGRELVQLEDLLHWAEGAETDNELVKEGQAVKELASGTIQLTDGLYSPQVEVEQFQTISDQVQELVSSFMEQVFLEHIEARTEKMVAKSKQICGSGLPVETCEQLDDLVIHNKTREFSQSKRDVIRHALPEIVNHVSDTNVEVAACISELLVEFTLTRLDRINSKLLKLQSDSRPTRRGTDAKVSRNFTFRAQDDASTPNAAKRKPRKRRADPEDEDNDVVDLPTVPLATEGPSLQHLGKTRPKPARVHRSRPSIKPSNQSQDKGTENNEPPPTEQPPSSPTPPNSRASIRIPPPPKDKPTTSPPDTKEVLEGDSPDAGSGKAGEDEDGEPKTSNGDQPVGSSSSLLEEIISHTSGSTGDLSNSQVKGEKSEESVDKDTSIKEKGDNLAKVLFQPKVPEDELPEKPASEEHQGRERNGISNEWEVVDGPEQETNTSPSPEIIKKTPPTIKEKPRKTADQPAKDKSGEVEAKKTPLIPSEHLTSLASILQKGPTKPGKNEGEDGSTKSSPALPSKPREEPGKDSPQIPSNGNSRTPELKDKVSPAPVPRPKPKPTRGKDVTACESNLARMLLSSN